MSDSKGRKPKRSYAPPRLVTYGTISHLTQNKLLGKLKDGGSKGKTRTR
jgi:hypothetical protein